ncbi:hypothetical protein B9G53_15295 [Pseudanabaena sp. SR411]|nr:hypothetical protein B9G53_15295 [Pseudanabaena sp. SR411]
MIFSSVAVDTLKLQAVAARVLKTNRPKILTEPLLVFNFVNILFIPNFFNVLDTIACLDFLKALNCPSGKSIIGGSQQ